MSVPSCGGGDATGDSWNSELLLLLFANCAFSSCSELDEVEDVNAYGQLIG